MKTKQNMTTVGLRKVTVNYLCKSISLSKDVVDAWERCKNWVLKKNNEIYLKGQFQHLLDTIAFSGSLIFTIKH